MNILLSLSECTFGFTVFISVVQSGATKRAVPGAVALTLSWKPDRNEILVPISELLNYNLILTVLASSLGDSNVGWHSIATGLELSLHWHRPMLTLIFLRNESPCFWANILWTVIFLFDSYSLCQSYFISYSIMYFKWVKCVEYCLEDMFKVNRHLEQGNGSPVFHTVFSNRLCQYFFFLLLSFFAFFNAPISLDWAPSTVNFK